MQLDSITSLTEIEVQQLLDNLDAFTPEEQTQLLEVLDELEKREKATAAKNSLLEFCLAMQSDYKVGKHHEHLARLLEDIAYGRKDRVTVSIAPRFGKSQLTSIYFPAWYIGTFPERKIMMVSHTADLAVDFGRKVRNIVGSEDYRAIFPDVSLAADSKSAGRWSTNKGGEYFACIHPTTPLKTLRGPQVAGDIRVGDYLQAPHGWAEVLEVMCNSHSASVRINNKVRCSEDHPIYVAGRGWIDAKDVNLGDMLIVESIFDILMASVRRTLNGYLEHTHVPQVVQHQIKIGRTSCRERV